jgi:membrane protein DedA with SNARE-associated domain
MNWTIKILAFFGNYTPALAFFGAIVGGEETLIFLAILAAHGTLNAWLLLIFFYLGICVSDLLWYFIGKSKFFDWLMSKRIFSKAYMHWGKLLNTAAKDSDFQALFLTKFMYGSRLPTIMYLARERMHIKPFIGYTLIINLIWIIIIFLFGWFAGKGIAVADSLSNNIVLTLFLIGIVLVIFTLLTKYLSALTKKWLNKTQKQ